MKDLITCLDLNCVRFILNDEVRQRKEKSRSFPLPTNDDGVKINLRTHLCASVLKKGKKNTHIQTHDVC